MGQSLHAEWASHSANTYLIFSEVTAVRADVLSNQCVPAEAGEGDGASDKADEKSGRVPTAKHDGVI